MTAVNRGLTRYGHTQQKLRTQSYANDGTQKAPVWDGRDETENRKTKTLKRSRKRKTLEVKEKEKETEYDYFLKIFSI